MEPINDLPVNPGTQVNPKAYSTMDGVITIRPAKFFGIFALSAIGVTIIAAILILIFRKDTTILSMIVFVAFISVLASPLLLFSLQRYYVDNEKIIHRNMLGVKKQLYWKDIKTIQTNPLSPTDIKLLGEAAAIKVYPSFYFGSGSELIKKFIRNYCADAVWKSKVRIFS